MNRGKISGRLVGWGVFCAAAFVLITFAIAAMAYRGYEHENALAQLQADTNAALIEQARSLEIELQKFALLPLTLAENSDVRQALRSQTPQSIQSLNAKLETLATRTLAPYIYVINPEGTTLAASNYLREDSFVGREYAFRPYFREALETGASSYFAKGELTGKAGLFLAQRIDIDDKPMGVIVVKVEFDDIVSVWQSNRATTFVTNSDSVVLFSSDPNLDYKTVGTIAPERLTAIRQSMQFGDEQLEQTPIKIGADLMGADAQGQATQAASLALTDVGWQIYRTARIAPTLAEADSRVWLRLLIIAIALTGLIFLFIWRALRDRQREQTTQWLQSEVARQTSELSATNTQLAKEASKREELNKRFRRAREELAQANRLGSIGAITTRVAHEVNQPVAAIQAFAENTSKLIARNDYERAKANLTSITELTQKIGRITTDLRHYARRGTASATPVPIQEIIDGVDLLVSDMLRSASVTFDIKRPDTPLPDIKVGKVRVEQVLVNLIQNANEALEDVENGNIEMTIFQDDKHVVFQISDNGPGIDPEIRSEIFNPFFTSKSKGLGIGLGIAKDIVSEFGGTLTLVDSDLGGANFELRLPKL